MARTFTEFDVESDEGEEEIVARTANREHEVRLDGGFSLGNLGPQSPFAAVLREMFREVDWRTFEEWEEVTVQRSTLIGAIRGQSYGSIAIETDGEATALVDYLVTEDVFDERDFRIVLLPDELPEEGDETAVTTVLKWITVADAVDDELTARRETLQNAEHRVEEMKQTEPAVAKAVGQWSEQATRFEELSEALDTYKRRLERAYKYKERTDEPLTDLSECLEEATGPYIQQTTSTDVEPEGDLESDTLEFASKLVDITDDIDPEELEYDDDVN